MSYINMLRVFLKGDHVYLCSFCVHKVNKINKLGRLHKYTSLCRFNKIIKMGKLMKLQKSYIIKREYINGAPYMGLADFEISCVRVFFNYFNMLSMCLLGCMFSVHLV